ncbi:metal ABC transporter ATP-binding protein [Erysipelothrix anatis]|uniref:metal ABC transporter ATP-binding protein n=1 Tax=Erysipelothrix anatis TaxID=2683713 RepID=UPI001356F7CC|nr:ATP-binding cassette domain-containing protein [Erysipelothrix anatis]
MLSIIEVDNVSFSYGKTCILHNVSFSIQQGAYVYIVGDNGAGKSTLVKLFMGVLDVSSGHINLGSRTVAYVPQLNTETKIPLSVYDVIALGLKPMSWFLSKNAKQRIVDVAHQFGIENLLHRKFSDLSGGQKQRVYLSRAMISNPDILILDEPLSGLDKASRAQFETIIDGLHQAGTTILNVTHHLTDNPHKHRSILDVGEGHCVFRKDTYVS